MSSVLYDTADQVQKLIAAGQTAEAFTTDVTAVLAFEVALKLEEAGNLHCDVVPFSATLAMRRGDIGIWTVLVDVAIRYGYATDDIDATTGKVKAASVAAHLLLLEEVNQYLAKRTNRTLATVLAAWRSAEIILNWTAEHLRNYHQFTGIARITYEVEKSIA